MLGEPMPVGNVTLEPATKAVAPLEGRLQVTVALPLLSVVISDRTIESLPVG